jgi:hypothetical protein
MFSLIRRRLMSLHRSIALAMMPVLTLTVITPMTASCQRNPSDLDRGIDELRELVRVSSGRPTVEDLARVESRYARTRTAALARFLRGYLYYSAQNFQAAQSGARPLLATMLSFIALKAKQRPTLRAMRAETSQPSIRSTPIH